MYKSILAAASVLLLAACGGAETTTAERVASNASEAASDVMTTKTKAVLIYADWCGSCKVLDPKIEAARAAAPMPGVEFLRLDYTEKDEADFYAQADAAGVGAAVREALGDAITTGQLLLIDADDDRLLGQVTKTDEAQQIVAKIKDAVAQS